MLGQGDKIYSLDRNNESSHPEHTGSTSRHPARDRSTLFHPASRAQFLGSQILHQPSPENNFSPEQLAPEQDRKNLLDTLRQKGLYPQFETEMVPKLQDAGLSGIEFTSMNNDQRKQFQDIVDETSNYVLGEKLKVDFQKLLDSLKQKGLYPQFTTEVGPKVINAGLHDVEFKDMSSDQRKQFQDIVDDSAMEAFLNKENVKKKITMSTLHSIREMTKPTYTEATHKGYQHLLPNLSILKGYADNRAIKEEAIKAYKSIKQAFTDGTYSSEAVKKRCRALAFPFVYDDQ